MIGSRKLGMRQHEAIDPGTVQTWVTAPNGGTTGWHPRKKKKTDMITLRWFIVVFFIGSFCKLVFSRIFVSYFAHFWYYTNSQLSLYLFKIKFLSCYALKHVFYSWWAFATIDTQLQENLSRLLNHILYSGLHQVESFHDVLHTQKVSRNWTKRQNTWIKIMIQASNIETTY